MSAMFSRGIQFEVAQDVLGAPIAPWADIDWAAVIGVRLDRWAVLLVRWLRRVVPPRGTNAAWRGQDRRLGRRQILRYHRASH